jgi:glycosyltransferase involved in cell wall biosynthesis
MNGKKMPQAAPSFSIGVTTYNRRDFLAKALSSILDQTFEDFEVLVGNDYVSERLSGDVFGVTDPRIRFINHSQNLGELKNMNYLLEESRGKYFTWLADDDLYARAFLQRVHEEIAKFQSPACVFTGYAKGTVFQTDLRDDGTEGRLLTGREFLHKYLARDVRAQGCYGVFDREHLRRLGGMQQLGGGFSPYSDNLLAIRAGLLERVVYIDTPLVFLRLHDGAISVTSPDVDAYTSAQEELCRECVIIFRHESVRDDFKSNLLLLLRWCVGDFYSVLERSAGFQGRRVLRYLPFLGRYGRMLGLASCALGLKAARSTIGYLLRNLGVLRWRMGEKGMA